MTHWIYAAIIIAIAAGAVGMLVGSLILVRIIQHKKTPPPVLAWLLAVLVALSFAQIVEQSRVLAFRLSYDGFTERAAFIQLYTAVWHVVTGKVLAAMALTTGAAVKLGLYCNKPDRVIVHWAAYTALMTIIAWVFIAEILDGYIP